jgi:hypothetical protein
MRAGRAAFAALWPWAKLGAGANAIVARAKTMADLKPCCMRVPLILLPR